MTNLAYIGIAFGAASVVGFVVVYCACVAAGRADAQAEEDERMRRHLHRQYPHNQSGYWQPTRRELDEFLGRGQ